jgi:hypothetical protein
VARNRVTTIICHLRLSPSRWRRIPAFGADRERCYNFAMAARSYVADIAGGTATATIQMQAKQTLKRLVLSWANAAAGKIELSTSPNSQIGTAQPDPNVIARVSCNAGTNEAVAEIPINLPVVAFQSIYVHCTGTGNLGTAILS